MGKKSKNKRNKNNKGNSNKATVAPPAPSSTPEEAALTLLSEETAPAAGTPALAMEEVQQLSEEEPTPPLGKAEVRFATPDSPPSQQDTNKITESSHDSSVDDEFQTPHAKKTIDNSISTGHTLKTEALTIDDSVNTSSSEILNLSEIQPENLSFESSTSTSKNQPAASTSKNTNEKINDDNKNKLVQGGNFGTIDTSISTVNNNSTSESLQTPKAAASSSAANENSNETPASTSTLHSNDEEETPKNEFQMVKLRKSNKMIERHLKETKLEFAEMVANALKRNKSPEAQASSPASNLEALRHMDSLKEEVLALQRQQQADDEHDSIQRLRQELLDMFNKSSGNNFLQEAYLLQWVLPLHRERDPQTGQWRMNAEQVELLKQMSTEEELSMVAGLGMVRSILQSNFKAINGLQCLEAIHEYAHMRLGRKKARRQPQNPWDLLANLLNDASKDSSEEDIHQRVCNALVQWVVREILGTSRDTVSSRYCFHAIFLVASLKLELKRLAPLALEQLQPQSPSSQQSLMAIEGPSSPARPNQGIMVPIRRSSSSPNKRPVTPHSRPAVVEQLLQSNKLQMTSPEATTGNGNRVQVLSEEDRHESFSSVPTTKTFNFDKSPSPPIPVENTSESAEKIDAALKEENKSNKKTHMTDDQRVLAAVSSYDGSDAQFVDHDDDETANERAARQAMILRRSANSSGNLGETDGTSNNELQTRETAVATQPVIQENEDLPQEVRDAHRVIRAILGPQHHKINVSDCFEAIRLYAAMIVEWKQVTEENQQRLESSPSFEEARLKQLEQKLIVSSVDDKPPPIPMISVDTSEHGETPMSPLKDHEMDVQKSPAKKPKSATKKKKSRKTDESLSSSVVDIPEIKRTNRTDAAPAETEQSLEPAPEAKEAYPAKGKSPTAPSITSKPQTTQTTNSATSKMEKRQKAVQAKVQQEAQASQAQAKNRNRLLGRLKRVVFGSKKKKSGTKPKQHAGATKQTLNVTASPTSANREAALAQSPSHEVEL